MNADHYIGLSEFLTVTTFSRKGDRFYDIHCERYSCQPSLLNKRNLMQNIHCIWLIIMKKMLTLNLL